MKRLEKTRGILNSIASSNEISRFASDIAGGVGGLVCNNLDALAAISCAIYKEVGGLFFTIAENREICEQKHASFDSLLGDDLSLLIAPQKKDAGLSGFLSFGEKSFGPSYYQLLENIPGFYFLNKSTLEHKLLPGKEIKKQEIKIMVGGKTPLKNLIDVLSRWSYRGSDHCGGRGVYSLRGGILDVFPLTAPSPIRIEFNGNKVESIRVFNIESQLSIKSCDLYKIHPPAAMGFSKKTKPLKNILETKTKTMLYITQDKKDLPPLQNIISFYADGLSFCGDDSINKKNIDRVLSLSYSHLINPTNKTFYGSKKMVVCDGLFSSGFIIPNLDVGCYVIPGSGRLQKGQRFFGGNAHSKVSSLSDLMWGDFLVHQDFGIGRYRGLQRVTSGGAEEENIKIEYDRGGSVYVPINKFSRVHKYIGGKKDPKLSKLGSSVWNKQKLQTKKSAEKDVQALVELYLSRKNNRGFVYKPDLELLSALKNSFVYKETEDQQKAISDVLGDMGKKTPMDRLVYGDVGFGKTEVALRAIVSAVSSGRCVFFLSPTTVLSDQHYITCKNRLSPLGLNVELLSRFRTKKEQKVVLSKLEVGGVDVLVGTHRLLGKDVSTKNLGMLVVDEEHRFGVKHKEYIRSLKKRVDVLTLTATPIPRTLQQSLVGIRDTSKIETPPRNRLPVSTRVVRFSWALVSNAIKKELSRGGQVYFVNNDIKSLGFYQEKIIDLVPEASVGVAHSKMTSQNLEHTVLDFFSGKINVLVCTSIVESGLDVQNANTMIINGAQNFGLSQLYQIRGRVGRGGVRAFCFLCVPKNHKLSKDSFQRLKAVEHYTALGSGYSIAMKDLEIRGAGNLFGFEQSGHIARVGLSLYNKILSETIDEKRGLIGGPVRQPVSVSFGGAALFGADYMPLVEDRLYYYQRLSKAEKPGEVAQIKTEVLDRFGKMTKEVKNLFLVGRVKVCFFHLSPLRVVFNKRSVCVELDGLPEGFEMGLVLSFFKKLEKESEITARVEQKKKGRLSFLFKGLGFKRGVKTCENFDSLFSRVITK